MTQAEEFEKVLPLNGEITEQVLTISKAPDPKNCFGTNTLKLALIELYMSTGAQFLIKDIIWGGTMGGISFGDDSSILLTTQEGINFMELSQEPKTQIVNFKKYDREIYTIHAVIDSLDPNSNSTK